MLEFIKWYLSWEALEWLRHSPVGEAAVALALSGATAVWARLKRHPTILHSAVGAMAVCVFIVGYNAVFDAFFPDHRTLPITQRKEFLSRLHPDPSVSFQMGCAAEDPSSCRIAVEYHDLLATFFTPQPVIVVLADRDPALANRLCIVTKSESKRPLSVLNLRAAFESIDIEPGLRTDGSLKPNEFILLVGSRR